MSINLYRVQAGPEGYLPPAAACMGVELPEKGEALVEGTVVFEEEAMEKIAEKILAAKNPVFFPGPLILWAWKEGVIEKAEAVKELAETAGARIIPMPDYRPKYPMIDPEVEINPNHPNLTIWHNKIDLCVFVGVHCHYANLALKIIRGGTDCYTVALCGEMGHEDAMISLRDVNISTIKKLTEMIKVAKGGLK
ncbi:CO dehydrogenase beta subunit/acetyl-CoA synthase epsilon subunit [Clostridium aceticum]|uniref:CO dehydrogenase beta subunit/acetyl-CoA synthase epsilon subunit n=1 Tax=Clostridium aceticum TaxID=84022 RepID=A0A0D8IAM4_9CLOT|nr:carbon monoxide dehydrogenase beta subunit family protein [Clostridium aceticum]AKL95978.1 CO dehydrogenase beta subunit/acetyl-CoA synthase epsilon subunit [Clostridium aceticum]KJF27077.1 carbon monoxide dehydrogenase [Clostridium aceticum]